MADDGKEDMAATPETETKVAEELERLPARHDKLEEGENSFVQVHGTAVNPIARWEELNLSEELLKGIYSKGFAKPSKIQAMGLPIILHQSNHVICQAKNGAGKTATFAVALIAKTNPAERVLQGLVISPTRELAFQNVDVIKELSRFCGITSSLGSPPFPHPLPETQILSGTPGKLREWTMKKVVKLKDLKIFVLDEADTMLEPQAGLGTQVADVAREIKRQSSAQVLLFSATFPPRVESFISSMAPNAIKLTMKKEDLTLSTTEQFTMDVAGQNKIEVLENLYNAMTVGQSVIFMNSRQAARDVANQLSAKGFAVTLITGSGGNEGLTIQMREERMKQFRDGTTRVLVTTDLLSRGIDVPSVNLVINFELPVTYDRSGDVAFETYLHRVGRTGRFGAKGVAINFVNGPQDVEYINNICSYYQCEINKLDPDFDAILDKMKTLRI